MLGALGTCSSGATAGAMVSAALQFFAASQCLLREPWPPHAHVAARQNGVPVYCIVLLLFIAVMKGLSPGRGELVPDHLRRYLKFEENYVVPPVELSTQQRNELASTVDLLNHEREIFNYHNFGIFLKDTPVIVVLVHTDLERLQHLIVSLAQVRYIHTALVIFSHSYYDETINKLILTIDFCRTSQIFYPNSNQLFPDRFPGVDPEDCLSPAHALRHKFNVDEPIVCSDRDARAAERKHHWWWTAHFIFNNYDWSFAYKGTVVFLAEDDYVLPDFLHILRYCERALMSVPGTQVISLGKPFYTNHLEYNILTVDAWSPPYDIGLAFNKTMWNKIVALSTRFCEFDDVSWSYSLLYLFEKLGCGHVDMVACSVPRVLSTRMFSNGRAALEKIYWRLKNAKLFPEDVKAVMVYGVSGRVSRSMKSSCGNGGWGDVRDHLLCLDPLMSSTDSYTEIDNGSSFDFIIVGGGTAGSTLAARLAEVANFTVLLVEAGGDPPEESIIPGLRDGLKASRYDWNFTTVNDGYTSQALSGGQQLQPRGKMLGGSGSLNDMVYSRGHPLDYEEWATIVGDTWNWANVLEHFKKTEYMTDEKIVEDSELMSLHGIDGEIEVTGTKKPTFATEKFLDAFAELGFDIVNDMTNPNKIGAGRFSHTVRNGRRDSSLTALLNKVRNDNLYVLKNAFATKVLIENNTAVGVKIQIKNKELLVYANKEIILSAGTFNTAKLMLLTGIGPEDHLGEFGIEVVKDLPVGDNLHDHVMVVTYLAAEIGTCAVNESTQYFEMIKYLYDSSGSLSLSDSMGAYIPKNGSFPNVPHFAFYPSCIPQFTITYDACLALGGYTSDICAKLDAENKKYELISVAVVLLKPKSRGRVRLRSTDHLEDPLIYAGTFSDIDDFDGYPEAMKLAWSLTNTSYLRGKEAHVVDFNIEECELLEDVEKIRCLVKNLAMSAWHSVGTAAMGIVADSELRVIGVDGLRVVDASVMPVIIRGNTNAPVVMVAEKAADFIKKTYGVE